MFVSYFKRVQREGYAQYLASDVDEATLIQRFVEQNGIKHTNTQICKFLIFAGPQAFEQYDFLFVI